MTDAQRVVARPAESNGGTEIEAMSQLPRDLAVIKMENESMFAMAAAHPRSHANVLADIKQQLAAYKAFATGAMYSKPVGKDDAGRMKYARGLSIRAAEALYCAYGHCAVRTDASPIDEEKARIEASFTDYQRGQVWRTSTIVSRRYKGRDKREYLTPVDRFWDVVVKAATSRQVRECIVRSVPPGLRAELENAANEELNKFLDESTTKKLVAEFASIDVTQGMLETLIGKQLENFTKEDRGNLLGVWNSIKDGETTVQDAFAINGNAVPEGKPAPKTAAAAMEAEVEKAKAAGPKEPEKKPDPESLTRVKNKLMQVHEATRRGVLQQFGLKMVIDTKKLDVPTLKDLEILVDDTLKMQEEAKSQKATA